MKVGLIEYSLVERRKNTRTDTAWAPDSSESAKFTIHRYQTEMNKLVALKRGTHIVIRISEGYDYGGA